jgi:ketosteroid isomerase-like protein
MNFAYLTRLGHHEENMTDTRTLIERAYAAFNRRDVDGALATMSDDVSWPKASEGGRVVGKEEVRAYWTRQWSAFDPHVEPREVTCLGGDETEVRVHQLVKDLQGNVLSDSEVRHVFTVKDGRIASMHLKEDETASPSGPSAAFVRR